MGTARPFPLSDRRCPADRAGGRRVPSIAGKKEFWEGSVEDLILCGAGALAREALLFFRPFRACNVFAFNPGLRPGLHSLRRSRLKVLLRILAFLRTLPPVPDAFASLPLPAPEKSPATAHHPQTTAPDAIAPPARNGPAMFPLAPR